MKPGSVLILLCAILTVLSATYMHESYHRYDLVTAAAASGGSGGSQDVTGEAGDIQINVYLIDHRTGRVWVHGDAGLAAVMGLREPGELAEFLPRFRFMPMERLSCADLNTIQVSEGCRPRAQSTTKK